MGAEDDLDEVWWILDGWKLMDGFVDDYEYRACEVSLFCWHTKSVAVALQMQC